MYELNHCFSALKHLPSGRFCIGELSGEHRFKKAIETSLLLIVSFLMIFTLDIVVAQND